MEDDDLGPGQPQRTTQSRRLRPRRELGDVHEIGDDLHAEVTEALHEESHVLGLGQDEIGATNTLEHVLVSGSGAGHEPAQERAPQTRDPGNPELAGLRARRACQPLATREDEIGLPVPGDSATLLGDVPPLFLPVRATGGGTGGVNLEVRKREPRHLEGREPALVAGGLGFRLPGDARHRVNPMAQPGELSQEE
jgi:hypothetical protein